MDNIIIIESIKSWLNENTKYNNEDLVNHHGIGAIIYDDYGKVLMQDHVKFNFWTIPVGKIKENQSIIDALKEELMEECGIKITKFKEVRSFTKSYLRDNINVKVTQHIFEIEKYIGVPKNLEPKKHRSQIFMTIDEIKKKPNLSHTTQEALKYLKQKGKY